MSAARNNDRVAIPGGFISEPAAFRDAPAGLEQVIKFMYRPNVRADGEVGLDVSTDAFVVDLSVVDMSQFKASTLAADCDFVRELVLNHEKDFVSIAKHLQAGTGDDARKAYQIAQKIGATEVAAVESGGGIIWFVVAALVLTGCVSGGAKHKATSPAATTTPKTPKGQ